MAGIEMARPLPHVMLIRLNSPPANALDAKTRKRLGSVLAEADEDLDTRALILTGTGAAFTAGADLREQQTVPPSERSAYIEEFLSLLDRIEQLRVPVIAAINGHCLGGGLELALSCDIRICARKATFVASGVNVGLIVSFHRLPQVAGLGPAAEMLLTGATYDAAQAERWGLVTQVCRDEELVSCAVELAQHVASRAPLSVETTKAALLRSFDLSKDEARHEQITRFLAMSATSDHAEALRAFASKRQPQFERR